MVARSEPVVGVCAEATVASNAVAAKAAVMCFTNMFFLPDQNCQEKTRHAAGSSVCPCFFVTAKRGVAETPEGAMEPGIHSSREPVPTSLENGSLF
jgi:hypothetical protein